MTSSKQPAATMLTSNKLVALGMLGFGALLGSTGGVATSVATQAAIATANER